MLSWGWVLPCTVVDKIVNIPQEKSDTVSQKPSIAHGFLGKGSFPCSLLLLHAGFKSLFNVIWYCTCCHIPCERDGKNIIIT